jgi:hypothetical protein
MSLTTCLTDYIGISGCTPTTTPDSGIYLDRFLQGVELKMIDQIATEQQADWTGVWADVQSRAIKQFEADVRQAFNERYRIKSISQSVDIQKVIDTTSTTTASAQQRGFALQMNTSDGSYVGSNMSEIYIQDLYLYSDYVGSVTLTIYDLDDGSTLKTKTQTMASGWNTIRILESYPSRNIFVSYDATNINSVSQDITKLKTAVNFDQNNDDFGLYYDYGVICCGVQISGATSEPSTPTTLTKGNDVFGLSGTFGLVCKWDTLVCNNLKTFETAFAYCLGIELMNERLYSSRLNEFTMFDREQSAELKQLYLVKYRGGILDDITYDGLLTQSVLGVNMDKHDCCIECDSDLTFAEARL